MQSRGAAGKEEGYLTDNELLLAISNIVEVKVGSLKSDMRDLKEDVIDLKEGLHTLDQRVRSVEQKQQFTNLTLENDVLPRLQTIEACYTSTYQRYADGIADMDSLKGDIAIVKKVVAEHSDRQQKIS